MLLKERHCKSISHSVRNTGTPTWNVLKISGVSNMRLQPFGGENIFCFSLELLNHPGITSLLENFGGENMTAASSKNAHEVMGQVWGSSYLTTNKSALEQ